MSKLVRSRRNGTVNFSRAWFSVAKDSDTAQLECLVVLPKQDLFAIPVAWEYSHSCTFRLLVTVFDNVNLSLISGLSKIAISSTDLAWQTGLSPGGKLLCDLRGLDRY